MKEESTYCKFVEFSFAISDSIFKTYLVKVLTEQYMSYIKSKYSRILIYIGVTS
jgi:hypothetical protein